MRCLVSIPVLSRRLYNTTWYAHAGCFELSQVRITGPATDELILPWSPCYVQMSQRYWKKSIGLTGIRTRVLPTAA